jgi:hypothetical protein
MESLQAWKKEMNNPKTSIMRRDEEVEYMLQEIKRTHDLKIKEG